MKNKTKKKKIIIKKELFCYVCKKKIKETQLYYDIGKDKDGKELFRHKRCKPKGILQ